MAFVKVLDLKQLCFFTSNDLLELHLKLGEWLVLPLCHPARSDLLKRKTT